MFYTALNKQDVFVIGANPNYDVYFVQVYYHFLEPFKDFG